MLSEFRRKQLAFALRVKHCMQSLLWLCNLYKYQTIFYVRIVENCWFLFLPHLICKKLQNLSPVHHLHFYMQYWLSFSRWLGDSLWTTDLEFLLYAGLLFSICKLFFWADVADSCSVPCLQVPRYITILGLPMLVL